MKTKKQTRRTARQLYRFCLVNGTLDDARVRIVARRLARSRQGGALRILSGFQRLVRLDRDRHTARVESATPLTAVLREGVVQRLSQRYGSRLNITFRDNPALIGGMRVRVASHVYDGTIRARLDAMEARL